MKKITIIGSMNMDIVVETPRLPVAGETISGRCVDAIPGGKGANQAYAIGKLGGDVSMIGAVGGDAYGLTLKQNLDAVGVNTAGVQLMPDVPTGQAHITVDDHGENSIVLISGANGMVTKDFVDQHIELVEACDILMMQLEIPLETVFYGKELAVKLGKTIIVDPAPALPDLPDHFWQGIDYIKPNETELQILVHRKLETVDELKQGAREMLDKGVKHVLVSLGGEGCLFVSKEKEEFFPANKVQAVDTTAAGDSFTAAFALALSAGRRYDQAIAFGQKVSAVVVTRKGAQTSIPSMEELNTPL